MKIVYTPQAKQDLTEINNYISSDLKNPIAAKNVVSRILNGIHPLADFPESGMLLSEKTGRESNYRCLSVSNYIIPYRIENDKVIIIRILDARMDYLRIIFSENDK